MKLRRNPVTAKFQHLRRPFMAEKKASKKHKARGHLAIAQSYSDLDEVITQTVRLSGASSSAIYRTGTAPRLR
jgi:hypothetical protein